MQTAQRFLHEINLIRVQHEAMIESTGKHFNMFKIIGVR